MNLQIKSSSERGPTTPSEMTGGVRHRLKIMANELLREPSFEAASKKLAALELECKQNKIPMEELFSLETDETVLQYVKEHFRRKTFNPSDYHREVAGRFAAHLRAAFPTRDKEGGVPEIKAWLASRLMDLENSEWRAILPPAIQAETTSDSGKKEIVYVQTPRVQAWLDRKTYDHLVRPAFVQLRMLSDILAQYGWKYEDRGIELPRDLLQALIRAAYTVLHAVHARNGPDKKEPKDFELERLLVVSYPLLETLRSPSAEASPGLVSNLVRRF